MARVSDASRTGPEGGRSAPSPLGREGAEGGLAKLMRNSVGREVLSVQLVSSKLKSFLGPVLVPRKSYLSDVRLFESGASKLAMAGDEKKGVAGRGEGMPATRGVVSLAVGMFVSTVWSADLLISKAVWLRYGAVVFKSWSSFGVAVVAIVEAVCAGVPMCKAAVSGCVGSLVTGGLGACFLVVTVGEGTGEDAASGDTGGLPLAFKAASLGECLRLGGIGVPDF